MLQLLIFICCRMGLLERMPVIDKTTTNGTCMPVTNGNVLLGDTEDELTDVSNVFSKKKTKQQEVINLAGTAMDYGWRGKGQNLFLP